MRTRMYGMYGGVGADASNGGGYPISSLDLYLPQYGRTAITWLVNLTLHHLG